MARRFDILINAKDTGAAKTFKRLQRTIMSTMGAIGGALAVREGFAFGKEALLEYNKGAEAAAKLEQILRSTGHTAGFSSEQLKEYAHDLQELTGIEDDTIVNAEALLASFKQIGGQVFKDATRAVLDMSRAMDQDLKSTAIQVGKALNDPIKGLSALSRVGVTFTDQQKEMITAMVEGGDVAEAQRVILTELNSEFGSTAQAMFEATKNTQLLTVRWGELKETIGEVVANSGLLDWLADVADATAQVSQSTDFWKNILEGALELTGHVREAEIFHGAASPDEIAKFGGKSNASRKRTAAAAARREMAQSEAATRKVVSDFEAAIKAMATAPVSQEVLDRLSNADTFADDLRAMSEGDVAKSVLAQLPGDDMDRFREEAAAAMKAATERAFVDSQQSGQSAFVTRGLSGLGTQVRAPEQTAKNTKRTADATQETNQKLDTLIAETKKRSGSSVTLAPANFQ